MREQFEKLPEIRKIMNEHGIYFMNYSGWYEAGDFKDFKYEQYINGAWYAYQELHKEIDRLKIGLGQLRIYCEDKTTLPILDQWSDCYVKSHKNIIYEIDKITGGE